MSFANAWTIARRDFRSYFTTPIAYIVLALFLAIMGYMFFNMLAYFNEQAMNYQTYNMGHSMSLSEGVIRPLYGNMNVILLFFSPAITMRLFAEERKNQTIQLLMTSPVSLTDIVFGKFLSATLFVAVMIGATLVYPITLMIFGQPDVGTLVSSILGTFLLTCCLLTTGILFSAMTENQIVAVFLTVCVNFLLWIISWSAYSAGPVWSDVLMHLSLINHFMKFSQGAIETADLVYYFSFIFFGLFLTHRVLDSFRWR
ncbi:MAG: ABC transporter permease subunit [Bdellovibrionales bacterium]|nr:ABC transporter permease subunit [Bdellovibrionales bacterium]